MCVSSKRPGGSDNRYALTEQNEGFLLSSEFPGAVHAKTCGVIEVAVRVKGPIAALNAILHLTHEDVLGYVKSSNRSEFYAMQHMICWNGRNWLQLPLLTVGGCLPNDTS